MSRDLSPHAVALRLEQLRALVATKTAAHAGRLAPGEVAGEAFAKGVAHRLEELRALCELTEYLHRAARP